MEKTEPRVFYSTAANLVIQIRPPRAVLQDGTRILTGDKIVQFAPMGDDKYGRLLTADKEVIEALEGNPMVLSPEQYNDLTTPAEKKLEIEVNEKMRLITQNNELVSIVQQLQQQIAAMESKPSNPRAK